MVSERNHDSTIFQMKRIESYFLNNRHFNNETRSNQKWIQFLRDPVRFDLCQFKIFYKLSISQLSQCSLAGGTKYTRPVEIDYFSFLSNRILKTHSKRSLTRLVDLSLLQLPIDLNIGYPDDYIERSKTPERLDPLLKALNISKIATGSIITWRGIITRIITAPYSNDRWELRVTLYKGLYFMDEVKEEVDGVGSRRRDIYYGYKAETVLTGDGKGTTDTNIQFCSVLKTKLGDHRLIFGAEVDCEDDEGYLEIKTHKLMSTSREEYSFVKFKLLKTWAQSFLAGIDRVLFAYKDRGLLTRTEIIRTNDMPKRAKVQGSWDREVCLAFGNEVLSLIKRSVKIDNHQTVYRVVYDPILKIVTVDAPVVGGSSAFLGALVT